MSSMYVFTPKCEVQFVMFPLRDICENPRSNVRACAAGDGAICSKNRKIVPYHGANPNIRNGARLRSPSLIMAPVPSSFVNNFLAGSVSVQKNQNVSHQKR